MNRRERSRAPAARPAANTTYTPASARRESRSWNPGVRRCGVLARMGLGGALAQAALYGASALDIAMGVATLWWPRRALWRAQAVLILAYTAIITVFLPEQWLHPYGPVAKNVPILALLVLLYQLEKR